MTTITDRRMPRGRAISALSLAVWWAKLEKNDKVRHIMTQIASLLAVATVFIDLWTPFYSQGGGGLIRETKLPMQELELEMQGGLMREGGVIAGFYGNNTRKMISSGGASLRSWHQLYSRVLFVKSVNKICWF